MIMPANYSVIAENELSYVDGGAFAFYVDPISDGGKQLANNIVTWIGNAYASDVMDAFIGTWFTPDNKAGDGLKKELPAAIKGLFTTNVSSAESKPGQILHYVTNAIGVASGIWVLGTQKVVSASSITALNITGSSATSGKGTNAAPYVVKVING
jgi:hypothetical protein